MKYYVVYEKKNNKFYGWTDDKNIITVFMKLNGKAYYYNKFNKLMPEELMSRYDLLLENYRIDEFYKGQTDPNETPLVLRREDFSLLEASMINTMMFILRCVNELFDHISYIKIKKEDKKMMRILLSSLSSDLLESINDDHEPNYGEILNISKFYEKVGKLDIDAMLDEIDIS